MKATKQVQSQLPSNGAFFSVPAAFEGADAGVMHAVKMEFATAVVRGTEPDFALETFVSNDRLLIDFGAVSPASMDLQRIEKDCDFIKRMVQSYPEEIQKLMNAVGGEDGGDPCRVQEAGKLLQEIGFTEKAARDQGGGLFFLVVLAAAALLGAGCTGVTAHGTAGKRGPRYGGQQGPDGGS